MKRNCIHCGEPIRQSADAACGWVHSNSFRAMCDPQDAMPEITEDEGYRAFWDAQTRKGDPQRNHRIVREAYAAGWKDALGE